MKYFVSIFYVLLLYFFWVGIIAGTLLQIPTPYRESGFIIGIIFSYFIANIAYDKGYSWWKHFLFYGFLSTGLPLIGIIKYILLKKSPVKNLNYYNEKEKKYKFKIYENKKEVLSIINYKNVLKYNSLDEYIEIFEKNKLNNLEIIMSLTENDYEKMGITILGDIKRLLIIFSKKELFKNKIIYINLSNENNNDTKLNNKIINKKCKDCNSLHSYNLCPECGSRFYDIINEDIENKEYELLKKEEERNILIRNYNKQNINLEEIILQSNININNDELHKLIELLHYLNEDINIEKLVINLLYNKSKINSLYQLLLSEGRIELNNNIKTFCQ